jgi:hypothetical protein
MAYARGRIGAGGTCPREHDVEPVNRARVPSQDRPPGCLLTLAGVR